MRYRLELATRTDKGLVRATNEDAFGTLPEDGMVVVADGMGGYQAGEVASQLAVDTVLRHLNRQLDKAPDLDGWQQLRKGTPECPVPQPHGGQRVVP